MCYAISCFENVIIELGCNAEDWKIVLNYMWSFTDIEYLDDWNEIMAEIPPEDLLEFKSFEEHDYEWISEEEFLHLYKLYINLDARIETLFSMVYCLGISHAYSAITNYGQRSLDEINKIIDFMTSNKFTLPEIESFQKYSIEESQGWGNRFNGKVLSKILNIQDVNF